MQLDELRSKTIILVTHDIPEAFELADRILLMDKGRIIQQGTPDELLYKPAGEYVRQFLQEQRFQLEAQRIPAGDYPALIRAFDHFKTKES
jgi:osmoprotectant transport system ATP-binding protein